MARARSYSAGIATLRADAEGASLEQALAALEIAPTYSRAQDLLLKLVGGR